MTRTVRLNTTLDAVSYGVLGALASREDPERAAANGVMTRLLREELERVAPGLWDRAVAEAAARSSERPPLAAAAVAELVAEALRARRVER